VSSGQPRVTADRAGITRPTFSTHREGRGAINDDRRNSRCTGRSIGSAIVGPLRDTSGIDWVELLVEVVLAAIGMSIAAAVHGRRRGVFN
jgi:hypothetical protein